ncbi:hypothetical protein BJ138DRAFT_1106102 [Hygrophoropsis aurantiaca]|uniref:Uncharacterized protein n=1 Tax=Hygrophoropsis aurantiaca TaxID=72124 RepID=A0ACB7ZVX5_9AGAM|nr:hypothetical protein BJ138DRAFT_1106102 [Hygrophoropsis aurantiaca]
MSNRHWFAVRRFFASLIRPFMPSTTLHIPGLFDTTTVTSGTQSWAHQVNTRGSLASKCFLREVHYCKYTYGVGHEFLVVLIYYLPTMEVALLRIERTVEIPNDSSFATSPHSSSLVLESSGLGSSKTHVALDSVTSVPYTSSPPSTWGKYNVLETLTFTSNPPSVQHLAVLLETVSVSAQNYQLWRFQCFWFADSVYQVLKKKFPYNCKKGVHASKRGTCCNVPIPTDGSIGPDVLLGLYNSAWDVFKEKGDAEEREHSAEIAAVQQAARQEAENQLQREREEWARKQDEWARKEEEWARKEEDAKRKYQAALEDLEAIKQRGME